MTPGVSKLRLVSLFSGIGAFEEGLKRANIDFETVCYSEKNQVAALSYCLLHSSSFKKNRSDVRYIDGKTLKNIDLIVHGSPCQSFSRAGKMEGGEKGSDTESSLLWESIRIIEESKPKVVVWENVPDVIAKRNKPVFEDYIRVLDETGYNSFFKIINSNDFGSAQKRRRMFVVSILREHSEDKFIFPKDREGFKPLSEYLESNPGIEFIVPNTIHQQLILSTEIDLQGKLSYKIKNATKQGYLMADEGDGIDWSFPSSKTRRGRVQKQATQTLTTSPALGTIQNYIPRFFTPREYWRLQEFTDEQFDLVSKMGTSNSALYQQAGNSINVNVAQAIFEELRKQKFI